MKAHIITHNLKILYKGIGKTKEIFLALDNEDLKELKKNILRAEKKEKVLKNMLGKEGKIVIDLE